MVFVVLDVDHQLEVTSTSKWERTVTLLAAPGTISLSVTDDSVLAESWVDVQNMATMSHQVE